MALAVPATARAQTPPQAAAAATAQPLHVTCSSTAGAGQSCAADTSAGVALVRSMGSAACLLGKTWGYDDASVWVSEGCSGEFVLGLAAGHQETQKPPEQHKPFEHVPNVGFLLYDGEQGQVYFRLFSYTRYLDQRNLDASYVDSFGNTKSVQQRQDIQLQKFFAPFSGWFLTPKARYYLYVWSAKTGT